jgi:S1-C subfamily serine protease
MDDRGDMADERGVRTDDVSGVRRTRRRWVGIGATTALALALVAGGAAWSTEQLSGATTATTTDTTDTSTSSGTSDGVDDRWLPQALPQTRAGGTGRGGTATLPGAGTVPDGTTSTDTVESTAASAEQQVGLVTIVTTLGYADAEAAGTGIVLTSDGVVLTNNHVIEGATSLEVTVESTGTTYTATVVGTDATQDVAVLQLDGATELATADIDADGVAVGDAVTAVGNANGTGDLTAAAGVVTALEESITTQSAGSTEGQTLAGLIEIDADVVAGDSGGAVLDADGEVVGMTTAASTGSANISGYAITIADALDVADQIRSGVESGTVTIGYPAFLGIELSADGTATLGGVIDGTPASSTGLVAGDTVTAVDGVAVTSGDALAAALAAHDPGDTVTLTWTQAATGTSASASVTLIAGPAD